MALTGGTRLGPYEILRPIGAGGMGEVYQARDTRLDRIVAIKVLPGALATDPELRNRFDREARAISQLAHANICTLFDVGDHQGIAFLVMELLDGESLEARLAQGPLPVDQALRIAIDIASALDAAHRAGIVHRDLKPGNVMLTRSGAKLLDFGLAKASTPVVTVSGLSMMPTTPPAAITAAGTILGTFQYMAPEQIEGMDADTRTDLFAFGCLIFEMLAGRKAFEGKTRASLLGAILKDEPPRISAIRPVAPAALDRIVQTCLAKDPDDRWQNARDLKRELEWIATAGTDTPATPTPSSRRAARSWMAAAAALTVVALGAAFVAWRATRPVERPLMHFTDALGSELAISAVGPAVAIAPDGTRIAFAARGQDGSRLFVRLLDNAKASGLDGTDGAEAPFFSPDGRWLGFFAGNFLKTISVVGGAAVTLHNVEGGARGGGFWGDDGYIYFAGLRTPVQRIAAAGGTPSAVTQLDTVKHETSHRGAQLLPGGAALLFDSSKDNTAWEDAAVQVQSIKTGARKTLVEGGYFAHYIHGADPFTGHLIYMHGDALFAAPMDVRELALTGPAAPALADVARRAPNGLADYAFTRTGTVVYVAGGTRRNARAMMWIGADGNAEQVTAPSNEYMFPRLSPDGRRIAVLVVDNSGLHLAVHEWAENRLTRLTFLKGVGALPMVWSPDGRHLVFTVTSPELAGPGLYWLRADGGGEPRRIVPGEALSAYSFAPDGRRLAYSHQLPPYGISTVTLDPTDPEHPRTGTPERFLTSEFLIQSPAFSPDGRWIAYMTSDASGRRDAFVRPFPGPGGKWQISTSGGGSVAWLRNRRELIYYDRRDLMVVSYNVSGDAFAAGQPRPWPAKPPPTITSGFFDAAPDGRRVVAAISPLSSTDGDRPTHLTFLLNFADELRRKAPEK